MSNHHTLSPALHMDHAIDGWGDGCSRQGVDDKGIKRKGWGLVSGQMGQASVWLGVGRANNNKDMFRPVITYIGV